MLGTLEIRETHSVRQRNSNAKVWIVRARNVSALKTPRSRQLYPNAGPETPVVSRAVFAGQCGEISAELAINTGRLGNHAGRIEIELIRALIPGFSVPHMR